MSIAKECSGCRSNSEIHGEIYCSCRYYLGEYNYDKRLSVFINLFCPCVKCLVKMICKDAKMDNYGDNHKCSLFNKKTMSFKDYIQTYKE